jgi:outer membrane protein assembly factor BamB
LAGAAGCGGTAQPTSTSETARPVAAVEPGSFRVDWQLRVDTDRYGQVANLFNRGDSLFVYTDEKAVQHISAGGRTVFVTDDVARPIDTLYPPLVMDAVGRLGQVDQFVAFPTGTGFTLMTLDGDAISEAVLPSTLTSPASSAAGVAYVGLGDDNGGRLVQVDPTKPYSHVLQRLLTPGAGIMAKPVWFQNLVYVGDLQGRVWGLNENLTQAWPADGFFVTERGREIRADLAVDSYAVYVAGTDGSLYALDRIRGNRRWQFVAGTPLFRRPIPTDRFVYQPIPDVGVAALPKLAGSENNRQPAWIAENAVDFLSHDDRRVYLLHEDGAIVAHDKETGEELFRSNRRDLKRFARNTEGPRIYAATRDGLVLALDPVTGFGEVGEVASAR